MLACQEHSLQMEERVRPYYGWRQVHTSWVWIKKVLVSVKQSTD